MLWVPVVFVCLLSGDCHFVYEEPEVSEIACVKVVKEVGSEFAEHPVVDGWKGTCIPVPNGKKI
jgi:hypothetical protein